MRKLVLCLALVAAIMGCQTEARMASYNLAQASEQFEVQRRVVFYNGITGDYVLVMEGLLSIHADGADRQLEVTVKTGDKQFKKHTLGLSDNVTYFCEQIDSSPADPYHYRVMFRPTSVIPDVDYAE